MDKPNSKERAEHVLEAIKLIEEFVGDLSEDAFFSEIKIQSAVQYQFLIIGEAVGCISDNILKKYKYPWHIPRAFRKFIIHPNHGVCMDRIYYATQDLEELKKQINLILKHEYK